MGTSSKGKHKDSKERHRVKDKERLSSASEKRGGGGKEASSRDCGSLESQLKLHSNTTKNNERRSDTRK